MASPGPTEGCSGGGRTRDPIGLVPMVPPAPAAECSDPAGCPPAVLGSCDAGSSQTAWASSRPSTLSFPCEPGQWQSWGSSAPENYPRRYEAEHFAFLWPDERNVSVQPVQARCRHPEQHDRGCDVVATVRLAPVKSSAARARPRAGTFGTEPSSQKHPRHGSDEASVYIMLSVGAQRMSCALATKRI